MRVGDHRKRSRIWTRVVGIGGAVLGTILFTLSSSANPVPPTAVLGIQEVREEIRLSDGHSIRVQLRLPRSRVQDQSSLGKVPVFMVFGGFETAAQVLSLVHTEKPYAFATFDYPFEGSRKFSFPGTFLHVSELRHSIEDTLQGIQKLFHFLEKRPEIDSSQIGIIGASFGSPFALAAAVQEPKIQRLVLVHGFADSTHVLENRLKQVFVQRNYRPAKALSWVAARLIQTFLKLPEPQAALQRLQKNQRVLMIEATEDEFIPKEVRTALWEGLRKSQASCLRVTESGGHLMPGDQKKIDEMIRMISSWMEEERV